MWRFIARPLDRFAIRTACGSVLPSPDGQSHAAEAAAFLRTPQFFAPQPAPASVEFTAKRKFQFASPFQSGISSNDLVRGRCEFAGKDWQQHPAVILLHGWNAELQYQWQIPFWSQLLARAGVNAFTFELPFHCSRRPAQRGGINNFLSGDLLHVTRAVHQALADCRALMLWLRAQGVPTTGLWGVSLGGWLSGLAAAHHAEVDFAVLLTPVVRMDRALKELAFCEPIRGQLLGLEKDFAPLNLVTHTPRLANEQMLVVASTLDLFAPTETIDELERAWSPETWRLPHGHISILLASGIMRRIVRWIAARAQQRSSAAAPVGTSSAHSLARKESL